MLPTSTPKASPYMAFIDLGRKIYNPKDIVDGTVELTLDKKLNCDSITVKLFGSARVFFTELSAAQGQLGKTIGYKQEKILIEDKTEVWKCDARSSVRETSINDIVRMASSTSIMPKRVSPQESPGLEPGLHKFNFSFQLPESGLETSFDAQHAAGCVRYYIQVEATRDGYMTFRKKLLFPIVKPVDLSTSKAAMGGFGKEETFSTKKGSVTVALTLDKVGYVPGEPVTGMITIKNKTDKSVKYSHLCLMQRAFCYANYPEVKIKESFHHTAGMGLPIPKITAGDTYSYPILFYIGALAPTFEMVGILSADYFLKLDVGFERKCSSKLLITSFKVPIVIGTHKDSMSLPASLADAPPTYEESVSSTHRSPAYAQSDCGLSNLACADDQDLGGYTPLYYHYEEDTEHLLRQRK